MESSSYTVEVDGNVFVSNTTVNIFRQADHSAASKIGSGKVAQADAAVYGGSGYLVQLHVHSGQQVSAGDLLFETLEGVFAPGTVDMNTIFAGQAGVVASVATGKGKTVAADEALIEFYPDAGMRISVSVPEDDLFRVEPGMTVAYLLPGQEGSAEPLTGTVEKISRLPDADATYGAGYAVFILPDSTDPLRYGLTVTVLIP